LLVNIEFRERKKLILNQFKRASDFVKIIVACTHRLPKLPESTQRKQAIPNKGSLFFNHCDCTAQLVHHDDYSSAAEEEIAKQFPT
jgi:hypothetical protein